MATAVIMPRQGQTVESCILTQWFREVGEQVSKGDLLFAYETDKASFEEESPVDGILLARFFEEGDEVPVLKNVALVGEKGEPVGDFAPEAGSVPSGAGEDATGKTETDTGRPAEVPEGETSGNDTAKAGDAEAAGTEIADADTATERPSDARSGETAAKRGAGEGGRVAISPRARRLAKEKRVSVTSLTGSGPGGRIIERDVLEAFRRGDRLTPLAKKKMEQEGLSVPGEGGAPHKRITTRDLVEGGAPYTRAPDTGLPDTGAGYEDVPLSNFRKLVSEAMYRSLQNSAQLTHHLGANASKMLHLRKLVKEKSAEGSPYNITINDMVCFAVIRALKQHPGVNAHFMGDRIRKFRHVNLGFAVDTERGLMVPALVHAGDYSLPGLSARLRALAEQARKGNLSPDLLSPGAASFTVSNLGNYGVEIFTPVINLPQVAILGVNTIIQRPVVMEDGNFGFQPFIGLSLTYDHRALDGGPATVFLAAVKNEIENLSADMIE